MCIAWAAGSSTPGLGNFTPSFGLGAEDAPRTDEVKQEVQLLRMASWPVTSSSASLHSDLSLTAKLDVRTPSRHQAACAYLYLGVLAAVHFLVRIERSNVQAADPYADFKRIFDKFATAEQVTGTAALSDDEDAEAGDDVKASLECSIQNSN